MIGEDTDREMTTQSHDSVEPCAIPIGSRQDDQARRAAKQTRERLHGGQSARGNEETSAPNPNIGVAEQWLCFLLGLICVVCGIWGLCIKYNQRAPLAHFPWLGPAYRPLRFTAVACLALGAVLVRWGWARSGRSWLSIRQKPSRSAHVNFARTADLFSARGTISSVGLKWKGKDQHERRTR
jgi:hypothetical protein